MSSATTTNVATNVATDKPSRKPTLPAKLSKFLVSNYSLIQALSAKGLLTDENVEAAYAEIKLFSTVEQQTEFYDSSFLFQGCCQGHEEVRHRQKQASQGSQKTTC